MKRLLICLGLLANVVALAAPAERPNILFLVADQMRGSAMRLSGNPDVITPNLDRMAAEGITFRRTYANVPVCCPARATLMTGTYAHVNGMVANDLRLRESEITIAELFRDAGYRTGFIGKWHLDGGKRLPGFVPPGPRRQGFEFWAGYQCHHQHFAPSYFRDTPEMILVNKFEPEASADFAEEFLRAPAQGKPFFLTVQVGPPHDPYGAPEKYMNMYDAAKLTMPETWVPNSETRKGGAAAKGGAVKQRVPGAPGAVVVPPGGREEVAAYYAAVTAIDEQVGRLLRVLQETGQDKNTIVLFTSDHGDMLGSHGMRRKRKPYEESACIPGVMRWPAGIPAGRKVDTLFSHVDMPPTMLALAGLKVPANMQGADLSRVARGETTAGPDAVLLQIFVPFAGDAIDRQWRGIVTDRYTYARFEKEAWVLFDNRTDPAQKKNLAGDPKHAALQRELDERLTKLMRDKRDAWSHGSNERVEENGKLYRHETFYTIDEYLRWAAANPDLAK
ncbi:MAG: sulfatase [Verrucomicrobiota bacterium]